MNFSYRKQSQFELFPGNQTAIPESSRTGFIFHELTISPENLIVVCIGLLMFFVISFSLGVERGKSITLAQEPARKIIDAQKKTSAIISPQLKQQPQGVNQIAMINKPAVVNNTAVVTSSLDTKTMPTQPAVPAIAAQPVVGGNLTIQVASFKLNKSAQKEAALLKDGGFDAFVVTKGNHFIVCVGRFAVSDDSKKIIAKLKPRYKDSVVRRL